MGFGSNPLKGLDQLNRTLGAIANRGSRKAAKAGTRSSLKALATALKYAVNSSSAPPRVKAEARKTIGRRLLKGGGARGKVGFGVGKPTKAKKKRAKARSDNKSRGGVGISAANIHWFVFGTSDRKQKRTGRRTGKIDPALMGILKSTVAASAGIMLEAARIKVQQVLAAEAARARKG